MDVLGWCAIEIRRRKGAVKSTRAQKKGEKNPFTKRQVLFVPLIASPSTHQQHQSKANERLLVWDVLGWCVVESRRRKRAVKSTCAKKGEKKNPFTKRQVLLAPPIASPSITNSTNRKPTKNFVGGMFWGWCAIKNREQRTKKIKKHSNVAQIQKKIQTRFRQKKNFLLDLSEKISRAFLAKKEKEKIKKKIPRSRGKTHSQNTKSFFPRAASPCNHQHLHLKATKRLVFFG